MAGPKLDALFNQVVDDPEVVAAVKDLALTAIGEAREMLSPHVAPQIRQQMVRTLLPTLVKSLEASRDTGTQDELRAEMKALLLEVRDGD